MAMQSITISKFPVSSCPQDLYISVEVYKHEDSRSGKVPTTVIALERLLFRMAAHVPFEMLWPAKLIAADLALGMPRAS